MKTLVSKIAMLVSLGMVCVTSHAQTILPACTVNATCPAFYVPAIQLQFPNGYIQWADGSISTTASGGGGGSTPFNGGTVVNPTTFLSSVTVLGPLTATQLQISGVPLASTNLSDSVQLIRTTTTLAGDLSGNLPSPTVAKVNGISVTGTPSAAQVLTATDATDANWQTPTHITGGGSQSIQATTGGNNASGNKSTVSGGTNNRAIDVEATVGGGSNNHADGQESSVGGGDSNHATGFGNTVSGGDSNNATSGFYSTVGGGQGNIANGNESTVGGGQINNATQLNATVAGGYNNTASGNASTIGGGQNSTAGGPQATVAGGTGNSAGGQQSTVGGGDTNSASASGATVPGGASNTASGVYSLAAGHQASATTDGSFVWSDSQGTPYSDHGTNSFNVRALGGIYFDNGTIYGDGSGLTGVSASEGNTFTSSKTFTSDVLIGGLLSGSSATFTNTVTASTFNAVGSAYQMNGVTIIDHFGNITASSATFTGTLSATVFSGSGAGLSNIAASTTAATLLVTTTAGKGINTLATDGTYIWSYSSQDGTVTRFSITDGSQVGVPVSIESSSTNYAENNIVYDGLNFWINVHNNNHIVKLSGQTGAVLGTFAVGGGGPMTFDGQNIDLLTTSGSLIVISTANGTVLLSSSTGVFPLSSAFDGTNLWATSAANIYKMSLTGNVIFSTSVGGSYFENIATDGNNVWIYDLNQQQLAERRLTDGVLVATYSVTGANNGASVVIDGVSVWTGGTGSLIQTRISDGNTISYSAPGDIYGLLFTGQNIWTGNGFINVTGSVSKFTDPQSLNPSSILPNYVLSSVGKAKPVGPVSGDLSGFYPNPTVNRINGISISSFGATAGRVLTALGTSSATWGGNIIATSSSTFGFVTITSSGSAGAFNIINQETVGSSLTVRGSAFIGSTLTVSGNAFSVGTSSFVVTGGGFGTFASTLTVQGNAFSVGGSSLIVTGGGFVVAAGTLTIQGNAFSVGGSSLIVTGGGFVVSAGTLTVRGNAFSVGGSTLSVSLGTTTINRLQLTNVLATSYGGTGNATGQPSGSATGDLSGSYPGPTVAKVNGVTVTVTPSAGQFLTADGATTASWKNPTAGGDLSGTYPNPTITTIAGPTTVTTNLTVSGTLNNGWERITNPCGAGVTTCTATCTGAKKVTGCGNCSVDAVLGVSVTTGGTSDDVSCTCTALTATTITSVAYCARVGL